MTVMCRETETYDYPGWEHLKIIYDVVDERRIFCHLSGEERGACRTVFDERTSDICPETYLTEEASGADR